MVYAGRIVREKGVDVLIRAAREVDAEFVICGDGRLEAMRELARRCGVERRVQFKGWLGPEELSREVADALVMAVPSLWPEPFGMVGIEALAAGRPVVASATGGIEDWLEHGVSGLCVEPGDVRGLACALNELLADRSASARWGRRQGAVTDASRRSVTSRHPGRLRRRPVTGGRKRCNSSLARATAAVDARDCTRATKPRPVRSARWRRRPASIAVSHGDQRQCRAVLVKRLIECDLDVPPAEVTQRIDEARAREPIAVDATPPQKPISRRSML